ncbi:maleylacetate reductase [Amorphus orientalis]|uniref:Maleylacetate reductase n=1 Tax=Amorphus orientalis TaxID=649198 RepID=A0AAE4ARU1_9HYPH|nr:maleylacetate reductase [Amorphus orientalis]MDQ0314547.1 maleylacetate reductase [Amorphus orientalis]
MTQSFTYRGMPHEIVFGDGSSTAVGDHVDKLGCRRALVLTTPQQVEDGTDLARNLGDRSAGVFSEAAMHTPVDVTERAVERVAVTGADCLVALGGGSTTGLGKAIAYRTDLPQIVIPTTYAGSEVTPILGQTEHGKKTTLTDQKVVPEVVIYDPSLTLGLPVAMSVTSALNAMAHAAEGLYAQNRNPIVSIYAVEGLKAMQSALPAIVETPGDPEARGKALYGAWLCGMVLGAVGMALHHKICHTLGGSFDTPHADTHAIMLPHTIGYNAAAVPELLAPVGEIFGGTPGAALYDFALRVGAPSALKDLGLSEADLDRAADLAVQNAYWNPRPIERDPIRALLQDAWEGRRPER